LLVAPSGDSTRPTADRAKEGLFDILGARVSGARFLDIFCGSGSVGIEALSRGAKEAVFVENSPSAIKAVKENLAKTRLADSAQIMEMTAEKAISRLAGENRRFEIIFLDPPYAKNFLPQVLEQITRAEILAQDGILIAETDSAEKIDADEIRVYGRTKFLFYKREITA
jgi:16S rRNA (guanine966-N2)-methyltransferase